jgi:hypothetical protein
VAAASDGSHRLYLVRGDRARWRTHVEELDFGDFTAPPVRRQFTFLGSAVGAVWLDGKLYVADLEAGVRILDAGAAGLGDLGIAAIRGEP